MSVVNKQSLSKTKLNIECGSSARGMDNYVFRFWFLLVAVSHLHHHPIFTYKNIQYRPYTACVSRAKAHSRNNNTYLANCVGRRVHVTTRHWRMTTHFFSSRILCAENVSRECQTVDDACVKWCQTIPRIFSCIKIDISSLTISRSKSEFGECWVDLQCINR